MRPSAIEVRTNPDRRLFESTTRNNASYRTVVVGGAPGRRTVTAAKVGSPSAPRGQVAAGTVHHVAWRTPDDASQRAWHEELVSRGFQVSPILDRQYFHSIYFREPSGVLYEIADDGPGFTRDMPVEELGSRVILPAWLEERRSEVEARLTPLPDPRAGWPVRS